MAVKIIGEEEDVKRYREYLEKQGIYSKSTHPVYKGKPDSYRVMQGEIKSCGFTEQGGAWKKGKADPEAKLYIKGIANAREQDRVDELIEPAGGQFENYNKNPILLKDHMYWCSSVIGQVTSLMPEYDGLHFEAWIGDPQAAPLTEDQKEIRSKVAQGIIRTVSIGFIPIEIKAPTWDAQGRLLTPGIITKWEMLELSLVAVPCNAGATFEMRSFVENDALLNKNDVATENTLPDTTKEFDNVMKAETTTVQSLIFDKKNFTIEEARKWARDHDFRDDKVDETEDSIRLRQKDPADFIEGSFRTIELTDGVKAVIGRLKDNLDMEKKLDELIEGMKSMTESLKAVSGQIEKNFELSSSILTVVGDKAKPCGDGKPEDEEDEMKKKYDAMEKDIADIKDVLKALIERL